MCAPVLPVRREHRGGSWLLNPYPHLWISSNQDTTKNFRFRLHLPYDHCLMTRKEAIRRPENLALETGHKRKHYIKRALWNFWKTARRFYSVSTGPELTVPGPRSRKSPAG